MEILGGKRKSEKKLQHMKEISDNILLNPVQDILSYIKSLPRQPIMPELVNSAKINLNLPTAEAWEKSMTENTMFVNLEETKNYIKLDGFVCILFLYFQCASDAAY